MSNQPQQTDQPAQSFQQPTPQKSPNTTSTLVDVSDSVPEKKGKGGLIILFVVILLLVFGTIAIVGGVFWYMNTQNNQEATSTPVNALNSLVNEGIIDVSNSLNFEEISESDPLGFLNTEQIESSFEENIQNASLLSNSIGVNPAGKTFHTAADFSINADGFNESENVDASIKIDVYSTYSENLDYDQYRSLAFGNTLEVMQNLSVDEFKELIGEFYFNVDVNANVEGEALEGTIEITYLDEQVYFLMDGFDIDDPSISPIIGQTIYFDASDFVDNFIEGFLSIYDQIPEDQMSLQGLNFDEIIESSLEGTDFDPEFLQRVGNPIRDVVVNNVSDFEVFTDISAVEPIRESASVCEEGDLNVSGGIETISSIIKDSAAIVTADQSYQGPSYQEIEEELDSGINDLANVVEMSDFSMKLRGCSENQFFSGIGVDVSAEIPFSSSSFSLSMDVLTADIDSDYVIEAPQYDEDVTEQLNQLFSQVDFTELFQMPAAGAINGFGNPETPPNDFNDSSFMNDSGIDNQGGLSVEENELGSDYDAYNQETQELLDLYMSEEITFDEYTQRVNELDEEYFGDL